MRTNKETECLPYNELTSHEWGWHFKYLFDGEMRVVERKYAADEELLLKMETGHLEQALAHLTVPNADRKAQTTCDGKVSLTVLVCYMSFFLFLEFVLLFRAQRKLRENLHPLRPSHAN